MTDEIRGRLMMIATGTLGLCLLVIVCGFMTIAVRAGDGEATRLITDNLWQLVIPLAGCLAGIVGASHFGPTIVSKGTPVDTSSSAARTVVTSPAVPVAPAAPADGGTSDNGGA